jgi:shikimate dehydrogenase
MKNYGVIGYPLAHSLSPPMHNSAFKALSLDAEYNKYQIEPDDFDTQIRLMKESAFSGLNVTIPYKRRIIDYLDQIDSDARAIGAVNTVKKMGEIWEGFNTDIKGFIAPLLEYKLSVSKCLLLGAGGAARAVIYSLDKYLKPCQITIAVRNKEKFNELLHQLQPILNTSTLSFLSFGDSVQQSKNFDLIVNATPLGTFPQVELTPLPQINELKDEVIAYDLVYNPQETKFLRDIKSISNSAVTINGIEMLIEQAALSFKIWTGREMPREVVRRSLLQKLE